MFLSATWTSLRSGDYGVRIIGTASAGDIVQATRRDGTTTLETVARVLWTGPDTRTGETVSIASIVRDNAPARPRRSAPKARRAPVAQRSGCPDCKPGACRDCDTVRALNTKQNDEPTTFPPDDADVPRSDAAWF